MKNICLADGICIFDCIEFNHRFRYGDVAADIDFLAMDLDFHGFQDLSRYFVGASPRPPRTRNCSRCWIFTNVTGPTCGQDPRLYRPGPGTAGAARDQARKTARAYFALAGEYAEAGERWAA